MSTAGKVTARREKGPGRGVRVTKSTNLADRLPGETDEEREARVDREIDAQLERARKAAVNGS